MKKFLSVAMLAVLVASFAVGVISSTVQSKPFAYDCFQLCNRTTYHLSECCKYDIGNDTVTKCQFIGWCYPE